MSQVQTKHKHINLMQPYVPPGTVTAVSEVLRSRYIGQGPRVDEFERKFSEQIVNGKPAVAVGSCTDALHLAYELCGIGAGDEVICPLFTCTATNIPLLYSGAKIRFCDVEPNSLNMDPIGVFDRINENTKAIVVVHYGGAPASQDIFDLAAQFQIPVVEDCAQAVGMSWAGNRGDFACFSFQAVKHITTGDGGMLVCPPQFEDSARRRRWFGIDRKAKLNGTWENDIFEVGYKYQMTDISAAMGLVSLDHLERQLLHRSRLRDAYTSLFANLDGISIVDNDTKSACWLMTVLVERREELRQKLAAEGIESDQVHYRNDRYTIFRDFRGLRGAFPNMDAIENKYLVLPLHMGMVEEDVERIGEVVRSGW